MVWLWPCGACHHCSPDQHLYLHQWPYAAVCTFLLLNFHKFMHANKTHKSGWQLQTFPRIHFQNPVYIETRKILARFIEKNSVVARLLSCCKTLVTCISTGYPASWANANGSSNTSAVQKLRETCTTAWDLLPLEFILSDIKICCHGHVQSQYSPKLQQILT